MLNIEILTVYSERYAQSWLGRQLVAKGQTPPRNIPEETIPQPHKGMTLKSHKN